jgi:hypothetical protein
VAGDSDPGRALAPQPEEIVQLFAWGGATTTMMTMGDDAQCGVKGACYKADERLSCANKTLGGGATMW